MMPRDQFAHTSLSRKLVEDGLKGARAPLANLKGGLSGALIGALREIAADMPGVRAPQKRAAMRERAERALQELEHALSLRDASA